MNSMDNLQVFAREIGHGGTRAAIAAARLFHGKYWQGHALYPHEINGVNETDGAARLAHQFISTYPLATTVYNAFFNSIRKVGSDSPKFSEWAQKVSAQGNPVILCHETLAEALINAGSKQPKFLLTLNIDLKPGEIIGGLDGIIVRSGHSKRILLKRGYSDEQVHVGTLVDPDLVATRDYDFGRRAARLELCQYMQTLSDLRWLQGDHIPKTVPLGISALREEYRGSFTGAWVTSGSGNYQDPTKEIIRSFKEPLASGFVNLVLIGGQDHKNSPMHVAYGESRRLGLKPIQTDEYSPHASGFQIVYSPNTKKLVSSSLQLISNSEVVLLPSATDIMGTTEAACVPAYIGDYRGSHEKSDREHALREGNFAYDWSRRKYGRWDRAWDMIFKNARQHQSDLPTLYAVSNNLNGMGGPTPYESNQAIKLFIERRINAVSKTANL